MGVMGKLSFVSTRMALEVLEMHSCWWADGSCGGAPSMSGCAEIHINPFTPRITSTPGTRQCLFGGLKYYNWCNFKRSSGMGRV